MNTKKQERNYLVKHPLILKIAFLQPRNNNPFDHRFF